MNVIIKKKLLLKDANGYKFIVLPVVPGTSYWYRSNSIEVLHVLYVKVQICTSTVKLKNDSVLENNNSEIEVRCSIS